MHEASILFAIADPSARGVNCYRISLCAPETSLSTASYKRDCDKVAMVEGSGTSGVTSGSTSVAERGSYPAVKQRTSSVKASTFRSRRSNLRWRLGSALEGAGEGVTVVGGTGEEGPAPGVAGSSGEEDEARRARM